MGIIFISSIVYSNGSKRLKPFKKYMYSSKSKNGMQYLDSLGGAAMDSDGWHIKKRPFLFVSKL